VNTTRRLASRALLAVAATLAFSAHAIAAGGQDIDQRRLVAEGAQLWPVYCAQCHNARPGSQFSPLQWDAITMHMRTQSNMPAKDIRAIREFLESAR
jgi:mono/diheme cytochrome c family protein